MIRQVEKGIIRWFTNINAGAGKVDEASRHGQKISAKGQEPFYKEMGFEFISTGMKKMVEIK